MDASEDGDSPHGGKLLQIVYDDGSVPFVAESEIGFIEEPVAHNRKVETSAGGVCADLVNLTSDSAVVLSVSNSNEDESNELVIDEMSNYPLYALQSGQNVKVKFIQLHDEHVLPGSPVGKVIKVLESLTSTSSELSSIQNENLSSLDHEYSQKTSSDSATREVSEPIMKIENEAGSASTLLSNDETDQAADSSARVVTAQELAELCSVNFYGGDVNENCEPESAEGILRENSTDAQTCETTELENVIEVGVLKELPGLTYTGVLVSQAENSVAKVDSETPSSSLESPMYTLVPNIDAATMSNIHVNISPTVARCLEETLAQKPNDNLLPVVKLTQPSGGPKAESPQPQMLMQGPVFKICKMVRKPDGTVQCIQTDMRDISLCDRQAVYRTMLEKFPDIVHRKVASVLKSRQKRRPRGFRRKLVAKGLSDTPGTASTTATTSLNADNESPALIHESEIPHCEFTDPLEESSAFSSAHVGGNETSSSDTVNSAAPNVQSLADSATAVSNETEQHTKEQIDLASDSLVRKHNVKKPSATAARRSTDERRTSSVPNQMSTIVCNECQLPFKTAAEFTSHALLAYVNVTPHLFDPNCILTCRLCIDAGASFTSLTDTKTHLLALHSTTSSPQENVEVDQETTPDHVYTSKVEDALPVDEDFPVDTSFPTDDTPPNIDDNVAEQNLAPMKVEVVQVAKQRLSRIYTCAYCNKRFQSRMTYKKHFRTHLGSQQALNCPLCGMAFLRKQMLASHMQAHLSVPRKKSTTNENRNKPTKTKRPYRRKNAQATKSNGSDDQTGNGASKDLLSGVDCLELPEGELVDPSGGPVLCELCGKQLKNPRQLHQHHRRRHNAPCKRLIKVDLTPTPCPECGRICSGPTALKNHQRQFCGLKEVLCEICGKVFPFGRRALSNHKYQVHKWRGSEMEKKALEKAREKSKTQKDGDREDTVKKKEFKPQVCELCGFVAKYSTSLRCHMVNKHKYPKKRIRVNHNSEPRACDKCGTICKGNAGLKLHQNRFCGRNQGDLSCPICGKICSNRKNLSRHKYGHKWFGTEKERAWKEKRKLLGIPLNKRHHAPKTQVVDAAVGAEVIIQTEDDSQSQVVQITSEHVDKTEDTEEMPTEVGCQELILDSTSQILQAIANDPQFAGQTIQVTTEIDANSDMSALATNPAKGTTFRVIRLMNHLGEPILAYLPDVDENSQ